MAEPKDYYPISFPKHDIPTFDKQAFEDTIRDHGVPLLHYRAFRCPVGMVDQFGTLKGHEDHSGCSNGFVYRMAGEFTGVFSSNSTGNRMLDVGLFTGSSIKLEVPTTYDQSVTPIRLKIADRIYMKDVAGAVVNEQLFTASQTGQDKMRFPVLTVEHVMDSAGQEYASADFEIRAGRLVWTGTRRPLPGAVCSIRYTYQPYWYVKQLIHEMRIAQVLDPYTHERRVERMPWYVLCAREIVFENETKDELAPPSPRQPDLPADDDPFVR